ncbi:MAG: hypothetical protein KIS85_07300 [Anaerolineales bacterium]|nr:hypothetical protein [Anaerolineales bacterium]
MNDALAIVSALLANLSSVETHTNFPRERGLYAFGLAGQLEIKSSILHHLSEGSFLYLGKSESSLHKRIKGTHLNTKRTGSSTLRRTLGAILREELNLTPIPRSSTEQTERRFRNYKFAPDGEKRLTDWMHENLLVTYWVAPPTVTLMHIEEQVIELSKPGLNLETYNPHWAEIKNLRKMCSELAATQYRM